MPSVPGQAAQLIEVDVAAGQHDGDPRAGGELDEAVEQRGDRRGGGALDDQLAALHDPDHRLEDVAIGERDDVVDEALHDGERDLANAADPQAVDDGAAVDGLQPASLDAALHGGAIGRLDADHLGPGVVRLDGHRDAGDQAAAADRDDDRVELGPVLDDLQPEGALA